MQTQAVETLFKACITIMLDLHACTHNKDLVFHPTGSSLEQRIVVSANRLLIWLAV